MGKKKQVQKAKIVKDRENSSKTYKMVDDFIIFLKKMINVF